MVVEHTCGNDTGWRSIKHADVISTKVETCFNSVTRVALLSKRMGAYRSATTSFRITVRISNRVILTGLHSAQMSLDKRDKWLFL